MRLLVGTGAWVYACREGLRAETGEGGGGGEALSPLKVSLEIVKK